MLAQAKSVIRESLQQWDRILTFCFKRSLGMIQGIVGQLRVHQTHWRLPKDNDRRLDHLSFPRISISSFDSLNRAEGFYHDEMESKDRVESPMKVTLPIGRFAIYSASHVTWTWRLSEMRTCFRAFIIDTPCRGIMQVGWAAYRNPGISRKWKSKENDWFDTIYLDIDRLNGKVYLAYIDPMFPTLLSSLQRK